MTGHLDATTRRLARYAIDVDFNGLPAVAVHETRRRIIDSIACAAAAYPEPFCQRTLEFAALYSGQPSARIWGSGQRTSIEMAAFANGTMVRYLDHSDTHFGKCAGHPSDMIAALIATAEAFELGGQSLVTAIVVAYEIYCGLCNSVELKGHAIDHATSTAVGTAVGVGRLLGLDVDQLGQALSLSLAPNLHLYNVRRGTLSEWKGCAGPNGARNGVFAALLASRGFTGPSGVVEGKGGFFELIGSFDWEVGTSVMPLIAGTHLKLHPACYHGQSAIDAAIALRGSVSLDSISEIHVEVHDAAFLMMAGDAHSWAPANRESADHSLPFTIATALQDGVLTSASYAEERLVDTRIKQIMDKVRVSKSAELTRGFPERSSTRMTILTSDGKTRSHFQEHPKGNAGNPLSDSELETKFMDLYQPWGRDASARRALDALWRLEQATSLASLLDTVCFPPG